MPESFDDEDVTRLRVALGRIARHLDRQTRGASLTRTEASVLATLEHRGPLRISELAEAERVNPTMLSRLVGKLEEAGLMERAADPEDGRAALVGLTDAGHSLHRNIRTERSRLLAAHLASLPASESTRLMSALGALESLADALATTPQEHRA